MENTVRGYSPRAVRREAINGAPMIVDPGNQWRSGPSKIATHKTENNSRAGALADEIDLSAADMLAGRCFDLGREMLIDEAIPAVDAQRFIDDRSCGIVREKGRRHAHVIDRRDLNLSSIPSGLRCGIDPI